MTNKLKMMAKVGRVEQHSTKGWSVSVRDSDAAKMSHRNVCGVKKKVVSEGLRKYDVCVT